MEPRQAASQYGLRYTSDFSHGITRRGRGRGFSFYHVDGKLIKDKPLREWLMSLAIPPAWQEVWIAPRDNFHILATGRDVRRRRQYIYHPKWTELQTRNNFDRIVEFVDSLPQLRMQVDADLRRTTLGREKVVALVVYLLEKTMIRIGNDTYRKENKTFGLTTLRDRHLELNGSTINFDFIGKSGQHRQLSLADRRAARAISRCQELPGQELFQYLDKNGKRQTVESSDVNAYLRSLAGSDISAKDFRTWGGTLWAATELAAMSGFNNERELKMQVNQALRAVAARLGNTLAVCRAHYVHPAVIEAYRDGSLQSMWRRTVTPKSRRRGGVTPEERATLKVIQKAR